MSLGQQLDIEASLHLFIAHFMSLWAWIPYIEKGQGSFRRRPNPVFSLLPGLFSSFLCHVLSVPAQTKCRDAEGSIEKGPLSTHCKPLPCLAWTTAVISCPAPFSPYFRFIQQAEHTLDHV